MSRRRFVAALGYGALVLAAPLAAMAQRPSGVRRIGFLTLASIETDPRPGRFRAGLRELGYIEGQTIAIEWRSAQGNPAHLADLAQDLLRLKVDLIVAAQTQAIQAAQILTVEARFRDEILHALVEAKRQRADALMVQADGAFFQSREAIAKLALEHTLPTLFTQPEHAAAGGLMSYGPNVGEHYHRAAYYVDRILKGTSPSELPIEQPTTFELVLNLQTAKALRLTLPQSLLMRVSRVIE